MIFFARTLKVLSFSVSTDYLAPLPALAGLCEELEAMAGHYMLEALFIEFVLEHKETADSIGSKFQKVEKVLVKPGWSSLRQVSFIVTSSIECITPNLAEAFQSLPDKYLSHLQNSSLSLSTFQFALSQTHSYSDKPLSSLTLLHVIYTSTFSFQLPSHLL